MQGTSCRSWWRQAGGGEGRRRGGGRAAGPEGLAVWSNQNPIGPFPPPTPHPPTHPASPCPPGLPPWHCTVNLWLLPPPAPVAFEALGGTTVVATYPESDIVAGEAAVRNMLAGNPDVIFLGCDSQNAVNVDQLTTLIAAAPPNVPIMVSSNIGKCIGTLGIRTLLV